MISGTGAFILNSGLSKQQIDDEQAKHLHAMAAEAYPVLAYLNPRTFAQLLSRGEVALGAMLLTPGVPRWFSGAALATFSGGLLRLYMNLPGMRIDGGILPTQDGIVLAKDSWLLAMGLSLVIGGWADAITKRRTKQLRKAKRS